MMKSILTPVSVVFGLAAAMSAAVAHEQVSGGEPGDFVGSLCRLVFDIARPGHSAATPYCRGLHALDWRKIKLIDDSIVIGEGQRITLNGLGQGYVTDRIANLLRRRGFYHVLVDLGEQRALEPNRDGTPWRIARRGTPGIKLSNGALATSEGVGCILGAEGAVHHLFDPRTGRSSHRWQTITVHHDSAAVADALSTAAYCASADEIASLVRKLDGLIVWATDYSGKESRWESAIRPAGAKLLRMG